MVAIGNGYKSGLLICASQRLVGKNLKSRISDLRSVIESGLSKIGKSRPYASSHFMSLLFCTGPSTYKDYVEGTKNSSSFFFFGSPFLDNQPPAFQWWYPKTITILLGQAPAFPMMLINNPKLTSPRSTRQTFLPFLQP